MARERKQTASFPRCDRDGYRPDVFRLAFIVALGALLAACSSAEGATSRSAGDTNAPPLVDSVEPSPSDTARAPASPFTPPTPPGCAGAGAYDYCFAFDGATPVALRVALPSATPEGAVVTLGFHRTAGAPAAVLDDVSFSVPAARSELVFYFQVYPATYTIDVDIGDASGTTAPLDVGEAPVETWLALEPG
jgi:hypothetical protein